jgi:hypothetical protein
VNNVLPLVTPSKTKSKSAAAVERLDRSFTGRRLHPAWRALAPCALTAINTAEEERGISSKWEAAKQTAAFSAVSMRAKKKRTNHGDLVLPRVMSVGEIFADADARLPQVSTDTGLVRSAVRS